ncbi:hypothetical protein CAPTEDRAFT_211530 [Capitella teleta]|uniref:VWFD domain-containing protein n=1 Tax=Capitella teleta TaxID=283909 RepID=R7TB04_CAPTE|nr:hypothetical protein CAPTEDRAFT_211530 [Capitella teleta]|eukprot:ELT90692.1 hypothetical protein CAPTEDRAFT_211530 [Capitella teleta]
MAECSAPASNLAATSSSTVVPTSAPAPTPKRPPFVCTCWGDPHCKGFSIPKITLGGSCRYVLATDRCIKKSNISSFEISASFKKTATLKQDLYLSFVVENGVDFSFQNSFRTNQLPDLFGTFFDNATAELGDNWKAVRVALISFPNGVEIAWDGIKQIAIYVPEWFKGRLCGICGDIDDSNMYIGDYDSSRKDDTTGCPNKAASMEVNSITTDVKEYGNSHFAQDDNNEQCKEECGMNVLAGGNYTN